MKYSPPLITQVVDFPINSVYLGLVALTQNLRLLGKRAFPSGAGQIVVGVDFLPLIANECVVHVHFCTGFLTLQALDTPVYAFDLTFPVPVIEKFLATLAKY